MKAPCHHHQVPSIQGSHAVSPSWQCHIQRIHCLHVLEDRGEGGACWHIVQRMTYCTKDSISQVCNFPSLLSFPWYKITCSYIGLGVMLVILPKILSTWYGCFSGMAGNAGNTGNTGSAGSPGNGTCNSHAGNQGNAGNPGPVFKYW